MALFGSGSSTQYWRTPPRDFSGIGARPIWLSAWTRGSSITGTAGLAAFQHATTLVQSAGPYCSNAAVSGWDEADSASSTDNLTGNVLVANTWQHVFAYYAGAASRVVYVGGVSAASNTTALSGAQSLNTLAVGTVRNTVLTTTRAVAEAAFGSGPLGADEIAALARGRNPLAVAPGQLLGYFPLRGSLEDLGPRQSGLLPVGGVTAKWTEHPPVDPPPRRRWFFPATAGGTTKSLAPAGDASTSQAATLGRSRALAAAGAAVGTSAAGLAALRALTGAANAAGSSAASLTRSRALAAAGSAAGTSAAALARSRQLTGTATATGSSAALLSAVRAMAAAASAAGSSAAALTRSRLLSAVGTALASQSSPALGKNGQSGLVPVGATALAGQTASLQATRALSPSGTAAGSSAASLARSRGLAPVAASATGATQAALARSRALVPSGAAAAADSAAGLNAVRQLAPLPAVAVASSVVSMAAIHVLFVAGTAEGTSSAEISAHAPPPSYIPASHTILVPLDAREVLIPLDPRSVIIGD